MNLMQLKPKESSFELKAASSKNGTSRVFRMMPITLADEVWLDETFGADGLHKIFTEINMGQIARVAFRFIHNEDKAFFKVREVTFITEDGLEEIVMLGGVELFKNMISGNDEKLAVIDALLDNIGISRPETDEVEEEPKKKVTKKKAKKKTKKK